MIDKSGVYKITCVPTGKMYIGSAVCFKSRWKQHKNCANNNKHHSRHFQRAWSKHGSSNFSFEVLLVCAKADLIMYEQKILDAIKPEFNVCPIAGSRLGTKQSEESKEKMSVSQTGKKQSRERVEHRVAQCRGKKKSAEAIERTSVARRGVPLSAETKEKLAAANRGKKCSEATKLKLSLVHKGNSYSSGKVHSPATRAKMAASRVGHVVTAETRMKIGNANRGKTKSVELREAMSVAMKGRKLSDDTKAKMSASKRGVQFSSEHRSNIGVTSRQPVYIGDTRHVSRSAAAKHVGKTVTTVSKWVIAGRVPGGNGKISGLPVSSAEPLLTFGGACGRSAI